MEKRQNKWSWKDSELVALLEDYGIAIPKNENGSLNRKSAIESINEYEARDAEEKIAETEKKIEKEKAACPDLKLIKVIFHSTGENDLPYVPVGINGAFFYFPKEREIKVPVYIINVLKDAVEDRMFPENTDRGRVEWKVRKVQRFPYSIVEL